MQAAKFKPGDRVRIQVNRLMSPYHLNGRTGTIVSEPKMTSLWGIAYTVELDGDELHPKIHEIDLIPLKSRGKLRAL
jgi:ribosomal protein L21E